MTDSPRPAAPRGELHLHPSLMPPSWSLRQALVGTISQVGTKTYRGFKRRPLSETSNNWPLGQGWRPGASALPRLFLSLCSMRNVSSESHQPSSWLWFTEGLCPDPRVPLKLPLSGMVEKQAGNASQRLGYFQRQEGQGHTGRMRPRDTCVFFFLFLLLIPEPLLTRKRISRKSDSPRDSFYICLPPTNLFPYQHRRKGEN